MFAQTEASESVQCEKDADIWQKSVRFTLLVLWCKPQRKLPLTERNYTTETYKRTIKIPIQIDAIPRAIHNFNLRETSLYFNVYHCDIRVWNLIRYWYNEY